MKKDTLKQENEKLRHLLKRAEETIGFASVDLLETARILKQWNHPNDK